MATFELTENNVNLLYELADLQHPHLKGDNHTRDLINKVRDGKRLNATDAFDCGKYYDRMLRQLEKLNDEKGEYLHAILAFKWNVK